VAVVESHRSVKEQVAALSAPGYLLTHEVADLLQVSPKTVSRWAKEGKLPHRRTLGGHRRYPEAEIRELLEKLTERPSVVREARLLP
jgi:excisionase family DNA binding protein